jgi:hypothetical protein
MAFDELTITLSDKQGRVSIETLTKALENALSMLRSIESEIVASGVTVRWEISRVSMRSPLRMTFAPRVRSAKGRVSRTVGNRIVKSVLQGIEGIESGKSVPKVFTEDALEAAKKMVRSVARDGVSVAFGSKTDPRPIKLTESGVKHIDELASKARLYVDFSTIEGRLEIVSVHEHNSVIIWETLTGNRIECLVNDDQLKQASPLLGKRVAVTGRVSYRNHVPKTVSVEGPLKVLRTSAELPQPKDIGPMDITEGVSSEEHVRRMRNG